MMKLSIVLKPVYSFFHVTPDPDSYRMNALEITENQMENLCCICTNVFCLCLQNSSAWSCLKRMADSQSPTNSHVCYGFIGPTAFYVSTDFSKTNMHSLVFICLGNACLMFECLSLPSCLSHITKDKIVQGNN